MTLLNPFSSIFRRLRPALLALACMMPLPALSVVAGPAVHLPVAVADGSFRFDVAVVPGETFYIDPYVAVGYTYATGAGDPNFRSVLLPAGIGDGLYDLFGFDSAGALQLLAGNLAGGMAYDFGAAGVDRFQVTGIEVSAGLDPAGRSQMMALIRRISESGRRVVVSSHDIDFIYEVCDYLYVLSKGHLLAEGTRREVFLQPDMLSRAGLVQPWLVRLHQELGYPLYESEQAFFDSARHAHGKQHKEAV